jgi:hypothetical protein
MATPERVQLNYVDGSSYSNIMVYDGDQWVSWMSSTVKDARRTLYQQLSMGGVSDWATDLQEYHDPPSVAPSWDILKYSVNLGINVDESGTRRGNWTQIECTDLSVTWRGDLTPRQRWSMADADDAWDDVLYAWRNRQKPSLKFSDFVANKFHARDFVECTEPTDLGCETLIECLKTADTGAAAHFVWNSIAQVHHVCREPVTAPSSSWPRAW